MAGYKLTAKNKLGQIIDMPLSAVYDENGFEIKNHYVNKNTYEQLSDKLTNIESILKAALPLNFATWEDINTISQLGSAKYFWKVGDEKDVDLVDGNKSRYFRV